MKERNGPSTKSKSNIHRVRYIHINLPVLQESFRHEFLRGRVDVLIVVHGPNVREDECAGYLNVVQYDVGSRAELTDQE